MISRFSNPAMADQNLRIGSDGQSKVQVFWTATIQNLLKGKLPIDRVAYGLAAYLEMLRGKNEKGDSFDPIEPTFTEESWKIARSDNFSAGFDLPAFDGWRKLNHEELDKKVIELRHIIREKGVKAALPN